ncbi:MAG: HNH endonuclease [Actinomycetota bacterium]
MELAAVVERLERVVEAAGSPDAGPSELRSALRASTEIESFISAKRAEIVRSLNDHPAAFAEAAIAETSGCSLGQASRERERADTLGATVALADALADGEVTAGHVDVLARASRRLDPPERAALLALDDELATAASGQSIAEFGQYVARAAKRLTADDGTDRLERQRRATRLRTWVDQADGMWKLRGEFDPELGAKLARELAGATRRLFVDATPDSAPSDALERTQHLEALALADLVMGSGSAGASRSSAAPPLVVVDASQGDGAGGPAVDWGIPVELPAQVLHDLFGASDPDVVVVANGLVLHAPGRLDLGRTTRLANRAQRQALRGLYSSCAVPGCTVHYDRCRLHHVIWWRHGGRTDLDNLLPVCQHHHTRLHDDGWEVSLDANRELTITLPDGQVLRTGPPRRGAA